MRRISGGREICGTAGQGLITVGRELIAAAALPDFEGQSYREAVPGLLPVYGAINTHCLAVAGDGENVDVRRGADWRVSVACSVHGHRFKARSVGLAGDGDVSGETGGEIDAKALMMFPAAKQHWSETYEEGPDPEVRKMDGFHVASFLREDDGKCNAGGCASVVIVV
jgi:hypothetical protein